MAWLARTNKKMREMMNSTKKYWKEWEKLLREEKKEQYLSGSATREAYEMINQIKHLNAEANFLFELIKKLNKVEKRKIQKTLVLNKLKGVIGHIAGKALPEEIKNTEAARNWWRRVHASAEEVKRQIQQEMKENAQDYKIISELIEGLKGVNQHVKNIVESANQLNKELLQILNLERAEQVELRKTVALMGKEEAEAAGLVRSRA